MATPTQTPPMETFQQAQPGIGSGAQTPPQAAPTPAQPAAPVNHGHRLLSALVNGAHQVGQIMYDVNNPDLTVQRQQQTQDQLKQLQQQHDEQYRKMIFESISDPNSTPEQRAAGAKLLQHFNDPTVKDDEKLNAITGYISAYHNAGGLTLEEQAKATRIKAGLEPNADTRYRADNPAPKAPKEDGPLEAGGTPYGVRAGGKEYLPSQLSADGNAPPEAKQIWQTIQQARAQKLAEEHRKEDEVAERQSRTIAAGFERMGMQQQFTELMAQYRSDLGEYRAIDKTASDAEANVKALQNQYQSAKTNEERAVADNELQNFYTTVVQKGGKKTAAELALTLKIGSLGLNLQQAFQKAATGELPEPLRKSLLEGMDAVAKEQRDEADRKKPELPEVKAPEGPHTKALKAKANGTGWKPPADAPAAPKEDGKVLKDENKKVIAKSQGGQWVQP